MSNLILASFVVGGACSTALCQLSGGGGTIYEPPSMPNVQRIPDVTGDGVPDLLVGYPAHDAGVGKVYVFEGPISLRGGRLPLPENAIGEIDAADGVTSFGSKILLMTYVDNVDRPTVVVGGKRSIDGVLVDAAIHIHIEPSYDELLIGGIVQGVSSQYFSDLAQGGLIPFDPSYLPNGVGLLANGLAGSTPSTGNDQWELEVPGYRDILDSHGHDLPGDWLRFELATYNAIKLSRTIKRAYGWDDGQHNAMQHALWIGALVEDFGCEAARGIGDHHETFSEPGREADSAVDKYNNEVAKQIMEQCIAEGKTITDFMYKVIDLIHEEDGTFITDPNDPRVPQILDGTIEIDEIVVDLK